MSAGSAPVRPAPLGPTPVQPPGAVRRVRPAHGGTRRGLVAGALFLALFLAVSLAAAGRCAVAQDTPAQPPAAPPAGAPAGAPAGGPALDANRALEGLYPFPRSVEVPAERRDEFRRWSVTPQGKAACGFSLVLRRDGWTEVPLAGGVPDRPESFVRLLQVERDPGKAGAMSVTVDFLRLHHEVAPLDYMDYLAVLQGWQVPAREIFLRNEKEGQQVAVPNFLAVLPRDRKTGEPSIARVGVVMDGGRVFLAMVKVRESDYPACADEMALAVLSFAVQQPSRDYAEPVTTVTLPVGAGEARFERFESWLPQGEPFRKPDAAGVGLQLKVGARQLGAMVVAAYVKSDRPGATLEARVKAVQASVQKDFGLGPWKLAETIDFAPSQEYGARVGKIQVYSGDEPGGPGEAARPGAVELRVAWLTGEHHQALLWLLCYSRAGDREANMVARRAYSLALDSLEFR